MSVKKEILKILEENRGKNLSGQDIADKLSVSRAAVWKAIRSLKEQGYQIYATTNKGYRMDENSDVLSVEGIRAFLDECYQENNVLIYESLDSTNSHAKRLVIDGIEHGSIIIADEQTAGRGRLGRSFFSPAHTGLYMSLVLRPKRDIYDSVLITIAAAVAVCLVIEELTNESPKIKWVNDVFLDKKKICGILTEGIGDLETGAIESIVVGIGVNLTTAAEKFPAEIKDKAGSVWRKGVYRNILAAKIANNLLRLQENLTDPQLIAEYKSRSFIIDKDILYQKNGTDYLGHVLDINDRGNLVVRTSSEDIIILESGEVTIRETCL
ncbi:biotin--[acetyl-CoA-carboxylase] ligase [Selenomonadales bacterium OttesenSCG-928-I06]|nr:biotin--[acetyl-CoA-carboxylase] ligase [Selenomonadales bacterium OttesenSCG-928-I06]